MDWRNQREGLWSRILFGIACTKKDWDKARWYANLERRLSHTQYQKLQILPPLSAIAILGLTAYGFDYPYFFGTGGFALLVSVTSIIVLAYSFAPLFRFLALYNLVAVLLLECLLYLFALSAFAALAALTAAIDWISSSLCNFVDGNRLASSREAHWRWLKGVNMVD